jgi:hypothetical protein
MHPHEETIMLDVRKRAGSADYENPEQNVADIPEPVVLPPNKARQAVLVRGMWMVLAISTALAVVAMLAAFLFTAG